MTRLITPPTITHPAWNLSAGSWRGFTANTYTINSNSTFQVWSYTLPSYPCTVLIAAECSVRRASSGGSFSGDIVLKLGSNELAKSRFKFWTYAAHFTPSMVHEFSYAGASQQTHLAFRAYNTAGSSYQVSDISWHITTKRVTQ